MKTIQLSIALVLWVLAISLSIAQEENPTLELLQKARTEVVNQEKEALNGYLWTERNRSPGWGI